MDPGKPSCFANNPPLSSRWLKICSSNIRPWAVNSMVAARVSSPIGFRRFRTPGGVNRRSAFHGGVMVDSSDQFG